jgi:hypothetical protein
MLKNLIILGQSIVISVLAITMVFTTYKYHVIKTDRDQWADFTAEAYTECAFECNRCIDRFASEYELNRKEINTE